MRITTIIAVKPTIIIALMFIRNLQEYEMDVTVSHVKAFTVETEWLGMLSCMLV